MGLEEKIREIVIEVLKKYYKTRILVIVTGGMVNADVSIKELKSLKDEHDLIYSLVFTKNAAKVHDIRRISEELEAESVIIDGEEKINVKDFLKQFKAVIIAVLTRNTAAKVANLFLDNLTTQIIVDALMLGIPVIASRDAADPFLKPWQDMGFIWMGKGLREAYSEILNKIEKYGVILCNAADIKAKVLSVIFGSPIKNEASEYSPMRKVYIEKNVITREDLAVYKGIQGEIRIPKNAVITPLAADYIRENSLKIYRG
ncbi:Flavoprotein [Caldanaerovirga acetigignens]|uniref:Flavoprotein n=1 Tax=Caldanaerovirga acetigignens TaxID=447595 RepID=A0A1M7MCF0_9FIRM|nr:flavoprotein [Caldanaerovirga acetigignens]SHM88403.1 Flavoprotein [Caldanaerovirga acetigignens]